MFLCETFGLFFYCGASCSEFLGPKYFDVIDEGDDGVIRKVLFLHMREYFVGDFNGTHNLDFYVRGFCVAGTLALRSHSVSNIKCETSRAKIMDFFSHEILRPRRR